MISSNSSPLSVGSLLAAADEPTSLARFAPLLDRLWAVVAAPVAAQLPAA